MRAYDLPLNYKIRETSTIIGNKVSRFLELNESGDGKWGKFIMIRVLLNLQGVLK